MAEKADKVGLNGKTAAEFCTLGVDVGSVSVSCVLAEPGGAPMRWIYRPHGGKPREALLDALDEIQPPDSLLLTSTTASPVLPPSTAVFDTQVCLIAAARGLLERVGAILFVGGERFGLIRFDTRGNYVGTRANSSCAAGTGSFLDQQARRLGLADITALAQSALSNTAEPPKISTRCAVFARTDLVHAQQAGYGLAEICDGLCRGLAQNIADTLLGGQPPEPPVLFGGGVAQNEAVRRHLQELFGVPVVTHELSPVLAAYGACLRGLHSGALPARFSLGALADQLAPSGQSKQYFYRPLQGLDAPPQSAAREKGIHGNGRYTAAHPVEVEIYRRLAPGKATLFMGIDIGSTSTKAVLTDGEGAPLAGFYTRTSGAPMSAAQALFEAITASAEKAGTHPLFAAVGATGAGRKFIGKIIQADLVVDEITAHARAATALDPEIDTIIEIGGQDSKFTTLRNGRVTFSHMNTVCAAGTGSFIEEHAMRLGVSLEDYPAMVRGVSAPLASDRCAVFMERDMNNALALGFSREEILAAALFSVRENYLTKVARGAAMGRKVCFQGATARNRALVAAFEEGLGRPLFVSPYCHLTGALGAALLAREQVREASRFRGLSALLENEIPVRGETCGLCTNHCRIRLASVAGETVAYGFLCGRDYDTARYVNNNTSGFDLAAERRQAWPQAAATRVSGPSAGSVIGIPAALTLTETLPLWKRFFSLLSIPFVTSEKLGDSITLGKEVAGAEFCTPLTALHGHARELLTACDYLFLPVFLEAEETDRSLQRSYCYYTQFSSALASSIGGEETISRCLMPVIMMGRRRGQTIQELTDALHKAGFGHISAWQTARALARAVQYQEDGLAALRARFRQEMPGVSAGSVPAVLLVGRPYTLYSAEMNKGIPQIFASLGVKTFTQDMVEADAVNEQEIADTLKELHWTYPARLMKAAALAARTPGLYPVFITSFKCSPDSFSIDLFKRLLDARGKPYLILQLDDHDSSVGYETRIEAGVASFRNHLAALRGAPGLPAWERAGAGRQQAGRARSKGTAPRGIRLDGPRDLAGRTLFLPNWDPLVVPLVAANLRREGIDAWPLAENPVLVRSAMRHNTGQCIPLNIIVEDFIDTVSTRGIDPARASLWMAGSGLSCNITMFPSAWEAMLQGHGKGFEKARVYRGDISHFEVSVRAALGAYKAHLLGGLVRRAACRTRPYETVPGSADQAVTRSLELLVAAFEGRGSKREAAARAGALFTAVPVSGGGRPKAAIFGDFYARDNDVLNQDLVRAIEEAGGEAVTTPYTEYVQIVASAYFLKWLRNGEYLKTLGMHSLFTAMKILGRSYHEPFRPVLGPLHSRRSVATDQMLARFAIRTEHAGESFDNLLKVFHIVTEHPDLRLFIQTSPAFCCPALVTEAMSRDIQRLTGVPVVSLTYDGTGQYRNDAIVPYLTYPRQEMDREAARRWRPVRARASSPARSA
jgi:predicted CoA-substrate-specific enzyme activase